MRATSAKLGCVRGLLIQGLRDLHDAEQRLSEANKGLTHVAESNTNPQTAACSAPLSLFWPESSAGCRF
ncbi:MAG: hypothetical protein JO331_12365 [Verrucomicrobia bacterium]|nr:hypothetical protein [Verrucomicrobiota bacterium]